MEERAIFRVAIGDRQIGLEEGESWIGRSNECRVRVDCSVASRRHARIVISGDRAMLVDGPSRNGTFLLGERVTKPAVLKSGDWIAVGSVRMTFRIVRPDAPTDAA